MKEKRKPDNIIDGIFDRKSSPDALPDPSLIEKLLQRLPGHQEIPRRKCFYYLVLARPNTALLIVKSHTDDSAWDLYFNSTSLDGDFRSPDDAIEAAHESTSELLVGLHIPRSLSGWKSRDV